MTTLGLLLAAALFEAGGDALVRSGLHTPSVSVRAMFLVLGAVVLFLYGCFVNGSPLDFGKALGVYVVLFFIVAQAISWAVFHQPPSLTTWMGGGLIVLGGIVVSLK